MDGQFFNIKIKSESVSWIDLRPPSFYLWAKDREDLKRILLDKNIMIFEIDNIVEKGSDWDSIVNDKNN